MLVAYAARYVLYLRNRPGHLSQNKVAAAVPHIDECNYCSKCIVDSHIHHAVSRSLQTTAVETTLAHSGPLLKHGKLSEAMFEARSGANIPAQNLSTMLASDISIAAGTARSHSNSGRERAQSRYSHARKQHMQSPAVQHSHDRGSSASLDDMQSLSQGRHLAQQQTQINPQAQQEQSALTARPTKKVNQLGKRMQSEKQHQQTKQKQQQQQRRPPPDLTDKEIMKMFPEAKLQTSLITEAMIRPAGEKSVLLPNCTVCRGCNAEIVDIHNQDVHFKGVHFKHGKGATNSWLFFARPAGETRRFILKIFCMPMSKLHGGPIECNSYVALERIRIMIAAWTLAQECGMAGSTPRLFVSPVNAIVPRNGYHVRWYGLWIEEARGITLHALWRAQQQTSNLMVDLLSNRLNKSQVIAQTVMDLLTAQCDRHAENMFVDQHGGLQFIDNDRMLGVVTHCGADSVLLPGGRYHSKLRVSSHPRFYEQHRQRRDFCNGPIDVRILLDYRCFVPNGTLGTAYPPALTKCLTDISQRSEEEIKERYVLSAIKPAKILKRRATDLLARGFEWTLTHGAPISTPKYRLKPQPPCCAASLVSGTVMCRSCWQPLMQDLITNETIHDDLGIIW